MNLNLSKIMNMRIAVHEEKIKRIRREIDYLKIYENILEFRIVDLQIIESVQKGEKVIINHLALLHQFKGPAVYIFELLDTSDKKDLLDKFQVFRKNGFVIGNELTIKRSCALFLSNSHSSRSNISYVGNVRKDIKSRIKQHLGFSHLETYSMQLRFWFPPDIRLRLHIINIS